MLNVIKHNTQLDFLAFILCTDAHSIAVEDSAWYSKCQRFTRGLFCLPRVSRKINAAYHPSDFVPPALEWFQGHMFAPD